MTEQNWARTFTYGASRVVAARSVDDVIDAIRESRGVRAVGRRHSFTDIGDADVLIDMSALADGGGAVIVDSDARTVTVPGAMTYAEVARHLAPSGMALSNLASLPHVSVAGAVATATHGSGLANGNLATAVTGLEFVTAAGEVRRVDRMTPDFEGLVVSLGALGLVTTVTLDIGFGYRMAQHVFDDLLLDAAGEHLEMILGAAYSVSIFTTFAGARSGQVGQVWLKRRTDGSDRSMPPSESFLDAAAATMQHHPAPGGDPATCTQQLGVEGAWSDRLPHFRSGHVPSVGHEVQSEFFVAVADASAALASLRAVADDFADQLMVAEIRGVAADELWMSPQYRRQSVAFHFTWRPGHGVSAAVRAVHAALSPFDPRPHWGKVFDAERFDAAATYEMHDDFVELAHRLDPAGIFRNPWWHRHIEG